MLEKDISIWKKNFVEMEQKFKKKDGFVHPMIYEDIKSGWLRLKLKF